MGIISRLQDPFDVERIVVDEDLLASFNQEDAEDDVDNNNTDNEVENLSNKRKLRKSKTVKPGGALPEKRPRGIKKRRRYENTIRLLEQADPDDLEEVTIYDFVTPKLSAFAQLLLQRHYMKAWNKFVASSEVDQESIMESGGSRPRNSAETKPLSGRNGRLDSVGCDNDDGDVWSDDSWDHLPELPDKRRDQPAFTAEDCFKRIDAKLRNMLRRKHVPMGLLSHLEEEVVLFFTERPLDVCTYELASSFHRMILHAVSQYMRLHSTSYYRDPSCQQRDVKSVSIENKNFPEGSGRVGEGGGGEGVFQPPDLRLSQYLEIIKS